MTAMVPDQQGASGENSDQPVDKQQPAKARPTRYKRTKRQTRAWSGTKKKQVKSDKPESEKVKKPEAQVETKSGTKATSTSSAKAKSQYSEAKRRPRSRQPVRSTKKSNLTASEKKVEKPQAAPAMSFEKQVSRIQTESYGPDSDFARSLNRLPNSSATRALKFPGLDALPAKNAILQFINETMDRFQKEIAVISMSGGLDAAVCAGLMAEAIGRKRLKLVYFIDSDHNQNDKIRAEMIAKSLGCPLEVKDIGQTVTKHLQQQKSLSKQLYEEVVTRERMITLHVQASLNNGLVVGAVNKTKWLLGYGVAFGDMACRFNPIGDLYRSQVLELARLIHVPKLILDYAERQMILPDMDKNDKQALSWKEADFFLYQMVDAKLSLAYLMSLGIDEEKVRALYCALRDSAFKRNVPEIPVMVQTYHPRSGELL